MTILYYLKVEDYLQWYLYDASQNKNLQYKSKRNWIFVTGFFILATFFFYVIKDNAATIISLMIAIISLLFYPIYQKNGYKKYYYDYAKNIYKKNENVENHLTIYTDHIILKDIYGETKINTIAIYEVVETNLYYFMRLYPGTSLIIPKKQIQALEILHNNLFHFTVTNNLAFTQFHNWKW